MRGIGRTVWLFVALGCSAGGPATYPVTGRVTFDGQPIAEGTILFLAFEGGSRTEGGPIENGQYAFRATAGRKRVEIRASRPIPGTTNPMLGGRPDREDFIPPKYNSETSLTAEVQSVDPNRFDFDLQSLKP